MDMEDKEVMTEDTFMPVEGDSVSADEVYDGMETDMEPEMGIGTEIGIETGKGIDIGIGTDMGLDIGGEMGIGMDSEIGGMEAPKDPLLSSVPFVAGTIGGVLFVSIIVGILLGKRRIKKGFDNDED